MGTDWHCSSLILNAPASENLTYSSKCPFPQ
jgi:hypothetical protein